mgnify:FL=1
MAGMSGIEHPPFTDLWTIPGEQDRLAEFQKQDRDVFNQVDATTHYHCLQIKDFLQAILTGQTPMVTGNAGRRVVAMFTAIYQSQKLGQPIRFPL